MENLKHLTRALAVLLIAAGVSYAQEATPAPANGDASAAVSNAAASNVSGAGVSASSKPGGAGDQFQERYPRYKVRAGDQFDVVFDLSPEFNQTVTVQPDGFVAMRGVGDVHVADQSVPELTATLREAYGKILNDPILSVVLKDFEKPYFVAGGQVGKPGKYDLRGNTTLIEAIAIAGGFTEASKHSQVLLFRRVDDQWMEAKIIDVKKMQKSGNLREDPFLHPGDMLFVPKNAFSKIEHFIPSYNMGTYFTPFF
jgi:polysaccharide biosynthesis/export protein